jgi:hypothetical protein
MTSKETGCNERDAPFFQPLSQFYSCPHSKLTTFGIDKGGSVAAFVAKGENDRHTLYQDCTQHILPARQIKTKPERGTYHTECRSNPSWISCLLLSFSKKNVTILQL